MSHSGVCGVIKKFQENTLISVQKNHGRRSNDYNLNFQTALLAPQRELELEKTREPSNPLPSPRTTSNPLPSPRTTSNPLPSPRTTSHISPVDINPADNNDRPIVDLEPLLTRHNSCVLTVKQSDQIFSSLTAEQLNSSAVEQQKRESPEEEKSWLQNFRSIMAQFNPYQAAKEMCNWGGRWRNRYREDPRKAERVSAELACMIKEGRIHRNAGACADDLWRRFV